MKWGDFVRQDKNTQGLNNPKKNNKSQNAIFKLNYFSKTIDKY